MILDDVRNVTTASFSTTSAVSADGSTHPAASATGATGTTASIHPNSIF
jgi:hypothetical protein